VRKAGRKSEIRYQTVLKGKALRKDMELSLIENPTLTTGATRQARGLRGWLQSNNSLGVGGVAPVAIGGNTAPTTTTPGATGVCNPNKFSFRPADWSRKPPAR
jgi:hypothetical protein